MEKEKERDMKSRNIIEIAGERKERRDKGREEGI
jgi:hypothetical protein